MVVSSLDKHFSGLFASICLYSLICRRSKPSVWMRIKASETSDKWKVSSAVFLTVNRATYCTSQGNCTFVLLLAARVRRKLTYFTLHLEWNVKCLEITWTKLNWTEITTRWTAAVDLSGKMFYADRVNGEYVDFLWVLSFLHNPNTRRESFSVWWSVRGVPHLSLHLNVNAHLLLCCYVVQMSIDPTRVHLIVSSSWPSLFKAHEHFRKSGVGSYVKYHRPHQLNKQGNSFYRTHFVSVSL